MIASLDANQTQSSRPKVGFIHAGDGVLTREELDGDNENGTIERERIELLEPEELPDS